MKPKKLVYGVGNNNADYDVVKWEESGYIDGKRKRKQVFGCPYYRAWRNMLKRCYFDKFQERQPTYKNCTVSREWHTFSNFRAWMVAQDWGDKHLDKDILFEGNKIYSADTCVFVTRMVNNFTIDRGAARGKWQVGVHWDEKAGKFKSQCCNPFSGEQERLGLFDCEQQAHNAWAKRKLELAHELAAEQTDPRVAKALIDRYSKPYTDKALLK